METYGYILTWTKGEFKDAGIYECQEIPGAYTWAQDGSLYIRVGNKLFQKRGKETVDFQCVEEFLMSKCEDLLKFWHDRKEAKKQKTELGEAEKILLRQLDDLNLLIGCMFK